MAQTEEIAWRHVWLKSVMIDAGKPFPSKIRRPAVTRRMSLSRRLENFTVCEQPSNRRDREWQSRSGSRVSVMIEGLPAIDVDESVP